jgi:hypothetical protein
MSNYNPSYYLLNKEVKSFSRQSATSLYTYASFPHSKIYSNNDRSFEPTEILSINPTLTPSQKITTRCPTVVTIEPSFIIKNNNNGLNETLIISICSASFGFILAAAFFYKFYYLKYKKRFERLIELDSDFGISSNELLD